MEELPDEILDLIFSGMYNITQVCKRFNKLYNHHQIPRKVIHNISKFLSNKDRCALLCVSKQVNYFIPGIDFLENFGGNLFLHNLIFSRV